MLGEESVAAGHIPEIGRRFFVVDPLDGTKEFIKRNGEFTVNIALVEDGVPVAGVVTAPALGLEFVADETARFRFQSMIRAQRISLQSKQNRMVPARLLPAVRTAMLPLHNCAKTLKLMKISVSVHR